MVQLSKQTVLRLRLFLYVFMIITFTLIAVGSIKAIVEYSKCLAGSLLPENCPMVGYRTRIKDSTNANTDDYQFRKSENFIDAEGNPNNYANYSLGTVITILFVATLQLLSVTLSMIVIWLVDHVEKPNGFTRVVQSFSACQVLMDYGYMLSGVCYMNGFYAYFVYGTKVSEWIIGLFHFARFIQCLGDVSRYVLQQIQYL